MSVSNQNIRRWSSEEERQLVEEVASGMTNEEIGKAHGRSEGAVAIRRRVIGAKLVTRGGKTPEEACEIVGLQPADIDDQVKRQCYANNDNKLSVVKRKLLDILDML